MTEPAYEWITGTVGEGHGRVNFERLLGEYHRGWWRVSSHEGNKHVYRAWSDDADVIAREATEFSALLLDAAERSVEAFRAEEAVVAFVRAAEARHRAARLSQIPVADPNVLP